jgi:hypothetical protein
VTVPPPDWQYQRCNRPPSKPIPGATTVENLDTTQKPRPCPDSEGLGYYGNEKIVVGYVSEVNGSDSAGAPGFVPTRYELIQLVKYWATLELVHIFGFFLLGQTGSNERRRHAFAGRRISRIATALGEEEVRKSVEEAEQEFSKTIDPRAWAIFKDGTPESKRRFRTRFCKAFPKTAGTLLGRSNVSPAQNEPFVLAAVDVRRT